MNSNAGTKTDHLTQMILLDVLHENRHLDRISVENFLETSDDLLLSSLENKLIFPMICLSLGLITGAIAVVLNQPILSAMGLLALGFLAPELTYLLMPGWQAGSLGFEEYTWSSVSWADVMLALLPILIFESAFSIKYFEFKKHLLEIVALAVPCFVVGFLLLGLAIYGFLYLINYEQWSLRTCLLYSATISATDPVAVVMLLSKLTVPHRLHLLLEGESLLNDGVAIVLYSVMNVLVYDEMGQNVEVTPWANVIHLVASIALSILVGVSFALLCGYFFTLTVDGMRQRIIIILFVYITYFFCETVHGSGILGIVAYALLLNSEKSSLSSLNVRYNDTTWQVFAFWANCILFVLTGLLASKTFHRSLNENSFAIFQLLAINSWAYIIAFVCRFFSLALYTILTKFCCGTCSRWYFPWSYTAMLTWSGLRGSIALLLTIRMDGDQLFSSISPLACGCVAFTVLITNFLHTLTATTVATELNFTQMSYALKRRNMLLAKNLDFDIMALLGPYARKQRGFWSEVMFEKVQQNVLLADSHESWQNVQN